MMRTRNDKQLNVFRSCRGIQYPVKHGADQQKLESVQRANQGHQNNGAKDLPPVRKGVANESHELPHWAPESPRCLTGGIGMECKGFILLRGHWKPQVAAGFVPPSQSSLWHIPVRNLHAVSSLVQAFADFLGDHYGTVLAARTAKTYCEIAFAFVDVVRQQVNQKIGDAEDKFLGLRK